MAIIRSKRQTNFTIIDNRVFTDNCLSFAAMGLLGYLLSKPDNWTVNIAQLVEVTRDTAKHLRRDGVSAVMKELKEKGFVVMKHKQSGGVDYIVYDTPQNGNLPQSENPTIGKNGNGEKTTTYGKSHNGNFPQSENPSLNKDLNNDLTSTEYTPLPPNATNGPQDCADALVAANATTGGEITLEEQTSSLKAKREVVPVQAVFDAYNEILGDALPHALILTDSRKRMIAQRWKQMLGSQDHKGKTRFADVENGIAWFKRFFAKVKLNPHWLGGNDRAWCADLDWILKPSNFIKILEWRPAK